MSYKSILQFFTPKDRTFFPLFEKAVNDLSKLAVLLHEAVNLDASKREPLFLQIDEIESNIEELNHKMNLELSKNFITPFDREDIHALISAIDDVANNLQGASNRMRLYQVEKITKSIRKITEINLEACNLINSAVMELKDLKNLNTIFAAVKKINKLESKSDYVFDKAVADIFENETDAKNVIKYKEVLSSLETATDKCKSVARVLEAIAVKHS
jgi:predicted phosphate transport protein (TIGR00153 family)